MQQAPTKSTEQNALVLEQTGLVDVVECGELGNPMQRAAGAQFNDQRGHRNQRHQAEQGGNRQIGLHRANVAVVISIFNKHQGREQGKRLPHQQQQHRARHHCPRIERHADAHDDSGGSPVLPNRAQGVTESTNSCGDAGRPGAQPLRR
ncbi:MAG TPA: hypothetical protein PKE37_15205 [Thiomonas arsenitoxydans]|nr:hypothetical protein [Thiomonas arsenitoxydans]